MAEEVVEKSHTFCWEGSSTASEWYGSRHSRMPLANLFLEPQLAWWFKWHSWYPLRNTSSEDCLINVFQKSLTFKNNIINILHFSPLGPFTFWFVAALWTEQNEKAMIPGNHLTPEAKAYNGNTVVPASKDTKHCWSFSHRFCTSAPFLWHKPLAGTRTADWHRLSPCQFPRGFSASVSETSWWICQTKLSSTGSCLLRDELFYLPTLTKDYC